MLKSTKTLEIYIFIIKLVQLLKNNWSIIKKSNTIFIKKYLIRILGIKL